jgi:hypothetical protein
MFSVRSRAFGAVFDDIVAFFRPTYSHVRQEKQRLELTREEADDASPLRHVGGGHVRVMIPPDYEPPAGLLKRAIPRESQGIAL